MRSFPFNRGRSLLKMRLGTLLARVGSIFCWQMALMTVARSNCVIVAAGCMIWGATSSGSATDMAFSSLKMSASSLYFVATLWVDTPLESESRHVSTGWASRLQLLPPHASSPGAILLSVERDLRCVPPGLLPVLQRPGRADWCCCC